jgi:hypothetical protein
VQLARAERGIWQRRFWNTRCATHMIIGPTWIISILTRSSTVSWHQPPCGRFQGFVGL